jgi:hypothetical protein
MTKGLYDDACALWRHNPALNDKGDLWTIPGVYGGILPYQAVGVTWVLLNLSRVGGVFVCDETGLGKTLQLFLIFVFTIHINRCVDSCRRFWSGSSNARKHLPENHVDTPGFKVTCPSQEYWAVPCVCANEITRRISVNMGPSLVLVHNPSQLGQFYQEWEEWIDVEATCFDVRPQFFLQHGGYKNKNIPEDIARRLRARYTSHDPSGSYPSALSSHYLVGTTAVCYEAHVAEKFQCEILSEDPRKPRVVPGIRWAAAHQDEAHRSYNPNTQNIQVLKSLKLWGRPKIVCWTATPWETTLTSVTNYFKCWWDKSWKQDPLLKEFSPGNLNELETMYQSLSSTTSTAPSQKRDEMRQQLIERWGAFCRQFIIMRNSKTTWMWHNVAITAKPPHYHQNVGLEMNPTQRTEALALHRQLETEARRERARLDGQPIRYNVTNAMIGRLHANFPLVLNYHTRKAGSNGFEFTADEITSKKWYQANVNWQDSPYVGNIARNILSSSLKLDWLERVFVAQVLGSKYVPKTRSGRKRVYPAKGLVLTNIPATARLLYEVSSAL